MISSASAGPFILQTIISIYRLQIRVLLLYRRFFVVSLSPFTQLLWSRLFVFALPLVAQQQSSPQLLQEDMKVFHSLVRHLPLVDR